MPVRVGDSFVADVNSFAQGVVFAVDSGAAVVQEALGTYNQSAFAQAGDRLRLRARRAGDGVGGRRGLVAPQLPGAVRPHDHGERDRRLRRSRRSPSSWLYLNGCTNFGGNLSVSVSATSCSSEADGRELRHRGPRRVGRPRRGRRDDARVAAHRERDPPDHHADRRRHQLRRARRAARARRRRSASAPSRSPTPRATRRRRASTSSPATAASTPSTRSTRVLAGDDSARGRHARRRPGSSLSIPQRDGAFAVEGRVAAQRRAGGYTYRVQIALRRAAESRRTSSTSCPSARRSRRRSQGVLATITPAQVPAPTATRSLRRLNQLPDLTSDYDQFTYTMRVQVRDAARATSSARTAARSSSTTIADLKARVPAPHRRRRRVVARARRPRRRRREPTSSSAPATASSTPSARDGSDLPGWPAAGDVLPYNPGSTALRDQRHRRRRAARSSPRSRSATSTTTALLDVVAADMEGKVYAWDHQGVRKAGFPVQVNLAYSAHAVKNPHNRVDRAIIASPALADLDGDGGLDIVVGGNDRHLYVWNGLGVPRPGFPVLIVDATPHGLDQPREPQGRRRFAGRLPRREDHELARPSATSTTTARSTSSSAPTKQQLVQAATTLRYC